MSTITLRSRDAALRDWQQRALQQMAGWSEGPFLISAAPGAGKTRPALEFARAELAAGRIDRVVIVCPTAPLTRQWARAAHALGLQLAPDAVFPRPPRGFQGVSVTYARVAQSPKRWGASSSSPTLVVADEAHHLGEELTWGESFTTAFQGCARWLLLSGTPFRSDATPIPGVSYDADGIAEPDVTYTYAEAVLDGICRPIRFVAYDGTLSWRSGEDVIETSFETVLSTRESSRRYRTAISTELPDGLPRILREADERLRVLRAGPHPEAGGLVIAADSGHARRVAGQLREVTGRSAVVVLHAEPRAASKLAEFTHSRDPWIVAVNMVSEGVDIPRLRVGVYATAAKTPLVFRQIVGRFVRTIAGQPAEPSWLYIPADAVLRDHAATVEHEVRRGLRSRESDGEASEVEFDDPPDRLHNEPGELLDFEPLSADVAPQMTLFGAPAGAPVSRGGGWSPLAPSPPPTFPNGSEQALPAFERRTLLRSERHQLVSELARRDGSSHREVNSWVNRRLGITSVEKASLKDLERSIDLLMRRLTARR
ncbi:MAG: DEAD/DEAH box helicase [Solirubrobacteraceae bacterium]